MTWKNGLLASAMASALLIAGAAQAQQANSLGVGIGQSSSTSNATGANANLSNRNSISNRTNTNISNRPTNTFNPNVTVNAQPSGANSGNQNGSRNAGSYNSRIYNQQSLAYAPTSIPRNAPGIAPPGLSAAGLESCNNSVSAGGSSPAGSLAIGFPIQDGPCNKRLNARTLWSFGLHEAAIQEVCLDGDMATALSAAGVHCVVGPNAPPPQPAYQPASYGNGSVITGPPASRNYGGGSQNCVSWNLFTGCQTSEGTQGMPQTATASVAPASEGAIYEDNKGRRFRSVPCSETHTKKGQDGACLVASN